MIVHILDTQTCQMAVSDEFKDDSFNEYWWMDGNAACDCNRGLWFMQAKGIDCAWDDDRIECGDDRYKVQIVCDGKIVYNELPAP